MEQPTISVIVPIYNVEEYLQACLDSILAQIYENLQIILVDDGSTDGCAAICDAYGAKDSRICVIHQRNGGVSAARNAGLAAAQGEWIGWVDADDRIDPDMFAYLLEGAMGEQADICICSRYEELRQRTAYFGPSERILLDRRAAMKALLEEWYMDSALYDKLWKRELFQDIRFPVGQTYEDLATVYRLFSKAARIVCLPEPKYHYRRRQNSITGDASLPNRMNHYLAARARYADMAESWPEHRELLEQRCVTAAIGIWSGYYHNPRVVRLQYISQLKEISQYAKPRIHLMLKQKSCGLAGRLILRLLPYHACWAFALAGAIGWLYQRKHGRML